MRLTKKQVDKIIELIYEYTERDIEVNGPRDYDINLYIPHKYESRVLDEMFGILTDGNVGDLQELFELQRALQKKIDFSNMPLIQYIRLMFIGIVTEACEALEQTDWKPWKQSTGVNPSQNKNFKKEMLIEITAIAALPPLD